MHYEDNVPVFICHECQDRDISWGKFYTEYLQLFRVQSNWGEKKHLTSCIIGFFCYMYEEFYKTDFIFVPQNPNVFSCKEIRDAQKLLVAFSGDGHETRRYIHWFFTKFIKRNTEVVAFAYINSPGIIRKYNIQRSKKNSITRSTKLSGEFINWCESSAPDIFNNYELSTINDLGALLSYIKFYKPDTLSAECIVISKAEQIGLIKNGRLNIKE